MKRILLNMLICPACLPDETALDSRIIEEQGEEISWRVPYRALNAALSTRFKMASHS